MDRFLEYAETYLADLRDMEILCSPEEVHNSTILYLNKASLHFMKSGGFPILDPVSAKSMLGQPITSFYPDLQQLQSMFSGLRERLVSEYVAPLQLRSWLLSVRYTGVWEDQKLVAFRMTLVDESYLQVSDISKSLSLDVHRLPAPERAIRVDIWIARRIPCQLLIDGYYFVLAGRLEGLTESRKLVISVSPDLQIGPLVDRPAYFLGIAGDHYVGFRSTVSLGANNQFELWYPNRVFSKPLRKSIRQALPVGAGLEITLCREESLEAEGHILEVSHEGAGIVMFSSPSRPYLPGEKVHVRFALPEGTPIEAQAEIRHVDPLRSSGPGEPLKEFIGLLFLGLDDQSSYGLAKYIQQLATAGGRLPSPKTEALSAPPKTAPTVFSRFSRWLNPS